MGNRCCPRASATCGTQGTELRAGAPWMRPGPVLVRGPTATRLRQRNHFSKGYTTPICFRKVSMMRTMAKLSSSVMSGHSFKPSPRHFSTACTWYKKPSEFGKFIEWPSEHFGSSNVNSSGSKSPRPFMRLTMIFVGQCAGERISMLPLEPMMVTCSGVLALRVNMRLAPPLPAQVSESKPSSSQPVDDSWPEQAIVSGTVPPNTMVAACTT
mmetsp:Transcript_109172/g.213907  ORF Transcript_109172/g.213907 Transcript_109172/m.213907 type:complete len:212 (-) Transcript_109172:644-1279(-)